MGNIPTENIQEIAAANDIVDVIGSYFPLKRAGANFRALCPFHQEKTPSFHVSSQRQSFHCFGCGAGGSVFRFVMNYEHLDFPAAVRKLAARAGVTVVENRSPSGANGGEHETRRMLLELHAEAAEWFHRNLTREDFGAPAREYLKARGIDSRIATDWQIGYAPESWDAFLKWALERGYERTQIAQSGLVKPRDEDRPGGEVYDRFRGRVMFPICNDVGEVIAFSGRTLQKDAETAKYLNSPETALFRKGNVLFGIHKTKRALIEANSAIVCEGQLDLITVFEAGIGNVVAPQGTAFTEQQARILKRFVNEVILCFDADAAGQKAAERSLDALLQNDLIVRVAEMPPGEDPDSIVRTRGKEFFEGRVKNARDFFDYWIEHETASVDLSSLGAKMHLGRSMAEIVARVHDPIMRAQVANKVSARLGVPPADFERLLTRPRSGRVSADDASHGTMTAPPRHNIAMLCRLALRHSEAREFLQVQDWREVLAQTQDAEMLGRILEADLHPDDPASISAFTATLSPGDEALVSLWLRQLFTDRGGVLQTTPPNALAVAKDWWNGLLLETLSRQLQIAEGRMKIPQLSAGEMTALQKQVVDLKAQLDELSAFSSVRVLDS